jgi:hypothetical protein
MQLNYPFIYQNLNFGCFFQASVISLSNKIFRHEKTL